MNVTAQQRRTVLRLFNISEAARQLGWPVQHMFHRIRTGQMLPPQIESKTKVEGVNWEIPCVEIKDYPRFAWRGLMLDVSRHFFTKDEVKKLLDAMALQKMSTFHWHLVDDNGWRIEIKKYPKLTEIGAWRKDIGFGLDPKSSTTARQSSVDASMRIRSLACSAIGPPFDTSTLPRGTGRAQRP